MPRKLGDTGSKELPQWCHFTLDLSFSLNNRAYQRLAKLLLLRRREEEVEVSPVAQAVLGTDNAISTVERGERAYVPLIFPEFTSSSILMLTNS